MHTAVDTGDRYQASGVQMHTWRGYVKYTLGSGCQLWGSRLASSTHVATEAWAGHKYSSWGLAWVKKEVAGKDSGGWCQ